MARRGDSPAGARGEAGVTLAALRALAAQRGGVDHPGLFADADNPWTDQLARLLRAEIAARRVEKPQPRYRHSVAARWRAAALLEDGPVLADHDPVYDIAWRVYAADLARLVSQPVIAECPWRGGWAQCAAACDRLAQGRADLKLLCAMADPSRPVGAMTLAQACAYRIAAFAPRGEAVLLAFYGGAQGWRGQAGFEVFAYTTGRRALKRVS